MRKAAAFALAIASVGSAVYFFPTTDRLSPPADTGHGGAAVIAGAPAPSESATPSAPRVFTPNQPMLAVRPAKPDEKMPATAPPPATFIPSPMMPETTARKLSSSRPADDDARRELVKDLQRELKRVGCYEGELNGNWTPASKKAMASFTDRVNATLPLDEPDYILLTLVQGHNAQACGQSCPTGQGLSEAGKCLPRSVLSQTARRAVDKAATSPPASDSVATDVRRPTPPRPAAPRVASAWSTVVTTPVSPPPVEARPATPLAPLPGRMAIGAPIDQSPAPAAVDRTKVELARRKAELTAAAAAQRTAEADAERRARLAEAQARKERELVALKQQTVASARNSAQPNQTVAALAQPAAKLEPSKASAPGEDNDASKAADNAAIALAARKAALRNAQQQQIMSEKRASEAAAPSSNQAAAARRAPGPRPAPAYVTRTIVIPPRPLYQAQPSYAPLPGRWTRTIFSDLTRMR